MFEDERDYRVIEYIYRDLEFIETYDNYIKHEEELGEHGVPIVSLHFDPFFLIVEEILGLNKFYFELQDNRDKIDSLYHVICSKFRELQKIALESPAKILISSSHIDYNLVPPYLYNEYVKPYLKPFAEELNKRNKVMALHSDADIKGIMKDVMDTGFKFLDCFTTSPMVSLTLEEALDVFEDNLILYGVIASTMLVPASYTEKEFKNYMSDLFDTISKKDCRIILGVADNVMPETDMKRLEWISENIKSIK
jgi:hypothetical protein